MKRLKFFVLATLLAGAVSLGFTRAALAHDVHTFGKVTVALDWVHEPAYVGFDNAVQVLVTDPSGKPITDISDKDLTVEVSLGSAKMSAQQLIPTADPDTGLGLPGEYEMHFIPTAPGNYTFHLKGAVTGQPIDETVSASDKTFNTVQNDTGVEFPNKVPAVADLSIRLDRVSSRSDDGEQQAKTVAYVALGVGIAALVASALMVTGVIISRKKATV